MLCGVGRRLIPLLAIGAALVAIAVAANNSGGGGTTKTNQPPVRTTLVARATPTPLPVPISGESVVASGGGLLILGGLDSAGASVNGVFRMDPATGRLHSAGALSGPLHDAAAAALPGQVLVFGGGTATSTDAVQSLPAPGGAVAATAQIVGRLPSVRSDLSAVDDRRRRLRAGRLRRERPHGLGPADRRRAAVHPGRHPAGPRPLHGDGGAGREDLRLRRRDGRRRREHGDRGDRPAAGDRPPGRPSPAGGLPRERGRARREDLRPRRRRERVGERPGLALRPGRRDREAGRTAAGRRRRRRRRDGRLDRLSGRRHRRRRDGPSHRHRPAACGARASRPRAQRRNNSLTRRRSPPAPPHSPAAS